MEAITLTQNPEILFKDMDGEGVLYSSEHKQIHVLNPTAKLIWEMCDGSHGLADIESALRASFSVPENRDISADIRAILDLFIAKGLVQNAG